MPRHALSALLVAASLLLVGQPAEAEPRPQVAKGKEADWFFVYKFNTRAFPKCADNAERACLFGGTPQTYKTGFGQQYVVATDKQPALQEGGGCLGDTEVDPVG